MEGITSREKQASHHQFVHWQNLSSCSAISSFRVVISYAGGILLWEIFAGGVLFSSFLCKPLGGANPYSSLLLELGLTEHTK